MPDSVGQSQFENMYAGKAPWDIGKPQPSIVLAADRVKSPLLDAGCGTGDNAIFFAERGLRVTGVDFVSEAVKRARAKAAERGVEVEFLVKDALSMIDWDKRFASVIDCGLFHVFGDDDRRRYVQGLAHVLENNGRLFLMCFSDAEPGEHGPRRVSRQELINAFFDGWKVESIEPIRFEVRKDSTEFSFSEGGPKAWFATIRRS